MFAGWPPLLLNLLLCSQMQTLQERVRELQSNHDAEVSSIMAKYRSLREQMAEYHMQLEAAMAVGQH